MNPDPNDTPISLLIRLKHNARDPAAWSEFVDRYGSMLLRWCRKWHLSETDAHDVTQEVLLALVRQIEAFDYDPTKSFHAWLKTVAKRTWHKMVEKRRENTLASQSDVADLLASIPAREDFEHELETAARREVLEQAMSRVRARVQPQTWEAFYLTTFEGQRGQAVAEKLGLGLSSVYMARSNVQKMLQEELLKLEPDGWE